MESLNATCAQGSDMTRRSREIARHSALGSSVPMPPCPFSTAGFTRLTTVSPRAAPPRTTLVLVMVAMTVAGTALARQRQSGAATAFHALGVAARLLEVPLSDAQFAQVSERESETPPTLDDLERAARSLGFATKRVRIDPNCDDLLPLPLIALTRVSSES
jgi:hypothetical protein